ncbi:hypothetical protein BZG78_05355 [Salinivibrio sp. MA351]|uniref:restriction endonuclease subunit S n=1 Tax=Salinivibrio sp. MA351 TaxID=1909453 RepID=UPI0009897BA8|nr:restriction endonuclease subunit S [Salinivibrio sp. MA351]OOF00221.1 hypothetical protein BZG78_05355 [Salinivibrio sp. MA351]
MSLNSIRPTKPTGYKWIGYIPSSWNLTKVKRLFKIISGSTPSSSVSSYWNGNIDWITPADLSQLNSVYIADSSRRITDSGLGSCGAELVPKDSIILSTRAPIGSLGITAKVMCTNQGCKALIPIRANTKYAYYFLREAKEQLNLRGRGTTFLELSSDELKSFPFPAPPNNEQQKIAQFLDYETAKIDALIDEQKRLIELLKEKRQAVISHAVTKGLNPDAPMKDSGVEWLGEVPEHWLCGSLGYYSRIETGSTPDRSNPEYWGGDIPWIKTGEVNYQTIFNSEESITLLATKESSVRLAPPGTLLMAMYGQGVTRGRVAILGVHATFNQACAAITVNQKLKVEFLELYLKFAYSFIRDVGNETSQMNLNASYVAKIPIVVPPLEEQVELVKTVNEAILKLSSLETESKTLSETLKERRSALISAAVTGKIDVRDWQPPEGADLIDSNAAVQMERQDG